MKKFTSYKQYEINLENDGQELGAYDAYQLYIKTQLDNYDSEYGITDEWLSQVQLLKKDLINLSDLLKQTDEKLVKVLNEFSEIGVLQALSTYKTN